MSSEARKNFLRIIDQVAESHIPITVKGKRNNAVIISENDWEDIQETLYIASHPELHKALVEGINTPFEECVPLEDIDLEDDL